MKTTVIHHSADYDGIFCREIAKHFLPDAELIGWDYKDDKIPFPIEGTVYVLDLSPDCFIGLPHRAVESLIWIDHHKSAIEKFPKEIKGYRIDGVAACRLSWQWFVRHKQMFHPTGGSFAVPLPEKQEYIDRNVFEPWAVKLAGEYDIWDKRDPNAEVFQFGLRSVELTEEHWQEFFRETNHEQLVEQLLENGYMLQRYQQHNDSSVVGRSFSVRFEGVKFLALNTARCNSLTFSSKDVPETGHEALMGFYFDGKQWNVSLYHAKHRTDLDLSTIAVKHGGGGHRGACGFSMPEPKFLSPTSDVV